ncbi:MAG TPA: NAD-dependent deacetylase [Flexistipes sinusarabici]|uniref:protein acetyllysine N-acetyltransferase n=1 Tax=Flexistipes sinusarabici TaxID=2352 RepID=A0A3D5QBH5_FLESI|nr:NAD-dependent deacetylase [Flexistipes sinusarabici]
MEYKDKIKAAADIIKNSESLVVTAGAGIGVDSGLPDFRGNQGFWKAYPPYERLGLSFIEAANPAHFERDPSFGWGFYGHRLEMYRNITPHKGFYLMLDWIKQFGMDYFVVTSNVDGHFQKAGFPEDKVYEIHGSIHYLQCLNACTSSIWENKEKIDVDTESMRARNVPKCINCHTVARPNILMFGDFSWLPYRSHEQSNRFDDFLDCQKKSKIAVIEIGAGTAIPSIRHTSERIHRNLNAEIIRINPREPEVKRPNIGIGEGSLKTLSDIDEVLND